MSGTPRRDFASHSRGFTGYTRWGSFPHFHGDGLPPSIPGATLYRPVDNFMYFYDSYRGKWLSQSCVTYMYGYHTSQSAGYMRTAGCGTSGPSYGILAPFDGTVVGYAFSANASSTANIEIRADGASIGNFSLSGDISKVSERANLDFDVSEHLSCYISSGSIADRHTLVLLLRKRRT